MNVMLYCNNEVVFSKFKRKIQSGDQMFLVSINAELLDSHRDDVNTIMLDSEAPFFSKETFEMIRHLNQVIKGANCLYDYYLYEVGARIEGGLGGNIQNLLYLIDIYARIIKENHIQKIYSERIAGELENEALLCVANYYSIHIAFYNNCSLKRRMNYSGFKPFRMLVSAYCIRNTIKRIRTVVKKNKWVDRIEYFDVGLILYRSSIKHVNWAIELMRAYDDQLKTGIFCYHAEEGITRLQDAGKNVKFVEIYGDWKTIIKSCFGYTIDKCKIISCVNKYYKKKNLFFQGINVTASILRLFKLDLDRVKHEAIIYDNMVKKFIAYNQFKLLSGSGDSNFISDKSFFFNAKKMNVSFYGFIDHTHMAGMDYPIDIISQETYPSMYKFGFFSKQSTPLLQLLKDGWKGAYYFFPDTTLVKRYCDIKNQRSFVSDSKEMASNILWAPSNSVYGIYSVQNFIQDNKYVISEINNFPCLLKVKYHLSQDMRQINLIHSFCKDYNVDWIDEHEPIEPYIEWADVIITTPSTVILDAALQQKFVICIGDSLSLNYVSHVKDYFYIVKREDIDFEAVLYDKLFRKMWIDKQNAFLEANLQVSGEKTIAEILKYYINELDQEEENKEG